MIGLTRRTVIDLNHDRAGTFDVFCVFSEKTTIGFIFLKRTNGTTVWTLVRKQFLIGQRIRIRLGMMS